MSGSFTDLVKSNTGSSEYQLAEPGAAQAVVVQVAHLGLVPNHFKSGEDTPRVMVAFELPYDTIVSEDSEKNGKPKIVYKEYTVTFNSNKSGVPSGLRQLLDSSFRKKLTDDEISKIHLSDILGKNIQLNITHKKTTKGNMTTVVSGTMPLAKGMSLVNPVNKSLDFFRGRDDVSLLEDALPLIKKKVLELEGDSTKTESVNIPSSVDLDDI